MNRASSPAFARDESVADGRAFLRSVLGTDRCPAGRRRMLVLPAPPGAPLARDPDGRPPTAYFASPGGATLAGWNASETIIGETHDLSQVRILVEQAHRDTLTIAHPGLPEAARRPLGWIGGHSFSPRHTDDPVWSGFPAVCFVAPRWTRRVVDGVPSLVLLLASQDATDAARAMDEYTALATGPAASPRPAASAGGMAKPTEPGDRGSWLAGTRAALDAIERGDLRKVVLARHLDVDVARTIDVAAALHHLARRYPTCTGFQLARKGADFFGATPETLVERRGRVVRAEAMAGSCAHGDEATLRASAKDAREHALVVEEIAARLRPFCDPVAVPSTTAIKRLANVSHLWTPIQATLRRPAHVLDLVATLHPTPAVAGTPTAAAVSLLDRTEPVSRGWFAAPFGWFDASGDGHFVVALRSCIRHARGVRLYAGAGIVRGSNPEREFDETVLKMRAILDVLHAVTPEPADRMG